MIAGEGTGIRAIRTFVASPGDGSDSPGRHRRANVGEKSDEWPREVRDACFTRAWSAPRGRCPPSLDGTVLPASSMTSGNAASGHPVAMAVVLHQTALRDGRGDRHG